MIPTTQEMAPILVDAILESNDHPVLKDRTLPELLAALALSVERKDGAESKLRVAIKPLLLEPVVANDRVYTGRVRKVDTAWIKGLQIKALLSGEWQYDASHGGTVANSYKYRASTETLVAVCSPLGECVLWFGEIAANKATLRGAARAAGIGVEDLFDGSVKRKERKDEARFNAQEAHSAAIAADRDDSDDDE